MASLALAGCATPKHPAPVTIIPASYPGDPIPFAGPSEIEYLIVPHEDDEWQDWSRIEYTPDLFKVFIVLSRGEQSSFCDHVDGGLQAASGELPPATPVSGRFTESCADSRLASWRSYFTDMATVDPYLPGDFGPVVRTRQFPSNGVDVCRIDNTDGCSIRDLSADVWVDQQGRGVLVSFNLGDGDQTPEEIDWAIDTVLANTAEFSIPNLTVRGMLGGYSNVDNPDCAVYDHPDHAAVHTALRSNRYPVPYQGAATCGTSPDAVLHDQVTEKSMLAAFSVDANGHRWGAHPRNYGWLHAEYYPLSSHDQLSLFMGAQSFWITQNR